MTKLFLYHFLPVMAMILLCFNTFFVGNIYIIIAFLLIIPFYTTHYKIIFRNRTLKFFFISVFLGSILNLFFSHNGIGGTLNFVLAVGLALYSIRNIRIVGYLALVLCLYTIYFVYYNIFYLGTDIKLIYESVGLSKNYPGFLMVACCCVWGYSKYVLTKQMPFVLPIICTVIAFFLDGRSSLGILAMMAVFCFFFKSRRYTLLTIGLGVLCLYFAWDELVYYYSFTNLSESGTETSRYEIWSSYLEHLDLLSFIFGLDTINVPVLKDYGGNPHNAFFNYHYRMGILGLGALLFVIAKSVRILYKEKEPILLVFVFFLLARIFFDACIGGNLDFFIFTILLFPILARTEIQKLKLNRSNKIKQHKVKNKVIIIVESLMRSIENYI